MSKRTKIHEHIEWDQAPVAGEQTSGFFVLIANGTLRRTRFSGQYLGIKPSDWTGEPMHFFANLQMEGAPTQSLFGTPVQEDRLTAGY